MAGTTRRQVTLATVADDIANLTGAGVTLVGVDGVDGAGKTHFADELADVLGARDVSVIRASVDGFHNPAEIRHRRGRTSPEGFFRDSYDYDALCEFLLDPLCTGDGRFVRAVYDVHQERRVTREVEVARDGDVLVLDGIFVHRPELRPYWDYSIFLDVDFATSIPRGAQRGYGHPEPTSPSNRRYIEGQHIYLAECRPDEHATVVIDNNDLAGAHITRLHTTCNTPGPPHP